MQKCFFSVGQTQRSVSMSISAALVLMVVALPQSSSAQFAPEQMTVNQTPIHSLDVVIAAAASGRQK